MKVTSSSPERPTYLPGVDGLRALAVMAVLLFHGNATWMPGGFLGVEVFFVISGFLITRGLVKEGLQSGSIDLKSFWRRRALRLLPALFLLLATILTLSALFEPGNLPKLQGDTLAALSYVTNWFLIFDNQSYFESWGRPSMLGHLWSLAIEEQFYLLWPIVLVVAAKFIHMRLMVLLVLAGALASYAGMALLFSSSEAGDTSRIYYGTDTRIGALLLGSLLAFLAGSVQTAPGFLKSSFLNLIGVGAFAVLVLLAFTLDQDHPWLYRGGFFAASLATCVLITSLRQPRSMISRLIGVAPLRWLGARSYGIYLWHWPIFLLSWPQTSNLQLFATQVSATILIAAVSYRFVEVPARNGGFGRAWATISSPQISGARGFASGFAIVAIAAVVAGLVAIGDQKTSPTTPPFLSQAEIRLASPSESLLVTELASTSRASAEPALEEATFTASALSLVECSDGDETDLDRGNAAAWQLGTCTTAGESPTLAEFQLGTGADSEPLLTLTSPSPEPFVGSVTAIGDSVMLGAAYALASLVPDIYIDAEVSRAPVAAISRLRELEAAGHLQQTVVVQIGNNGPLSRTQFEEILAIAGQNRRIFFLSLKVPRSWETPNNEMLAAGIADHSNATLIDWKAATADRPELFWVDEIHLVGAGTKFYAALVADALSQ